MGATGPIRKFRIGTQKFLATPQPGTSISLFCPSELACTVSSLRRQLYHISSLPWDHLQYCHTCTTSVTFVSVRLVFLCSNHNCSTHLQPIRESCETWSYFSDSTIPNITQMWRRFPVYNIDVTILAFWTVLRADSFSYKLHYMWLCDRTLLGHYSMSTITTQTTLGQVHPLK